MRDRQYGHHIIALVVAYQHHHRAGAILYPFFLASAVLRLP